MLPKKLFFSIIILLHLSLKTSAVENRTFPANFKFGAATASYQVEGGWHEDGKGECIWDPLIHEDPELVADGETADVACDSYHQYETDIQLLKELGVDFYRLSISWTRILPTGYIDDGINEAGVTYYQNVLNLLEENGIEAMVTIYHWDLPLKLQQDIGGFLNESFVDIYADYARLAFETFGDKVKYWITFNEPYIVCQQGYESGSKAPMKTDNPGIDLYICGHVLLKAHAAAYRIYDEEYRSKQNGKVSMALNTDWVEPLLSGDEDIEAADRILQFRFGWFAHPVVRGNYPQVMIDRIANRSLLEGFEKSRLPEFTDEEIENIKGTYDFIGINHYTSTFAQWIPDNEIGEPSSSKDVSVLQTINLFWETSASYWLRVVPWGLGKLCKWTKDNYNDPEIIITENGYSDIGGILEDDRRINYIREYLSSLLGAVLDDGANVTAYTLWSLMDNFEWFSGYTEKFGLYSVNFSDPARPRTPKASAEYYRNVIQTRCLTDQCIDN